MRIELTTARLRIECSTTELLWQREGVIRPPVSLSALARTRTAMPFGTTPSRWRVYQFHHQGMGGGPPNQFLISSKGPTRLGPVTSRVTDPPSIVGGHL